MQKKVEHAAIPDRVHLKTFRRAVRGEIVVLVRTHVGGICFASEDLAEGILEHRGARLRVLDRGLRYHAHGLILCALRSRTWFVRYRRSLRKYGPPTACLDAFDTSWHRTSFRYSDLALGQRFVYEG